MDIPLNATIKCTDGEAGRAVCVIVNPIKEQITHLVVQKKGGWGNDRLIPVDLILETNQDTIKLVCSLKELEKAEPFTESEFIPYPGVGYLWPFNQIEEGEIIEHERIPPNELAIRRGYKVDAVDGSVGTVDEFLVDPRDDRITHLVMREGHLWGQKDVTIPVSQIDHIESDVVFLKFTKAQVGQLPSIPLKRKH